jgi:hypothetical protein
MSVIHHDGVEESVELSRQELETHEKQKPYDTSRIRTCAPKGK